MRILFAVLLLFAAVAGWGQDCAVPERVVTAKGFALDVQNLAVADAEQARYLITFKLPDKSDEVLASDQINCKGWMPSGGNITSIELLDVKGLPESADFSCNSNTCTWQGGALGCVEVLLNRTSIQSRKPVEVQVLGHGSLFGINRSYQCKLQVVLQPCK